MRRILLALGAFLLAAAPAAQTTPIPWHPKAAPAPAASRPAPGRGPASAAGPAAPSEYLVTFDRVTTVSPGVYLAQGNVRFTYGDMLLTADAVTYDSERETIRAEGNVAVDFGDFTVSGTVCEYDLRAGTGRVTDAYGLQKNGDFVVVGREIRKTGPDWYEVVDGTLTSCTAATPPWSVRMSRGRFHVDHYAYLRNPRFRIRDVPALYTPYLVWPLKPERSTGLLIPEVGNSTLKGFTVSGAFYWASADWWDDTFYFDHYEKEGWGFGEEFRYALTPRSYGWMRGYYIRQESDLRKRWDLTWTHVQDFSRGWYFFADVNLLSDIDFPKEYQRDYARSTTSRTDSRLFLVRRWGPYGFTLRLERRLQYFTEDRDLTQRALPLVEFRSALQPLGRGLYGGFETSAALLHRESAGPGENGLFEKRAQNYGRLDLHPFAEWPLHPAPWLDLTPRLEGRATWYGDRVDPLSGESLGGDLTRLYGRFALDLAGPRLYRRYPSGLKHVIEPFAGYVYVTRDAGAIRIPRYDEVDEAALDLNQLQYGVRNRFYGKTGTLLLEAELYQRWSFDRDLTILGDRRSPRSPAVLAVRFWPEERWSGDLRLTYNPLARRLASRSLSLAYRPKEKESDAFVRVTYLKTDRLTPDAAGTSAEELRVAAYLDLLDNHVTVNPVAERDLLKHDWRNLRLVFWYRGSCYSLGVETGRRTIGSFRETNYRFLVSLKGAGTVVDLYGGTGTFGGLEEPPAGP